MSLENILNKIEQDTAEEIKQIFSSAKNEEKAIVEEARTRAQQMKKSMVAEAVNRLEEEKRRKITLALLDRKKMILEEKQKIISLVYDRILEKVSVRPDKEYLDLIREIIQEVAQGDEELIVSLQDKRRIGPVFLEQVNRELVKGNKKGNLVLSSETRTIVGGFFLKRGRTELNLTLPVLVADLREKTEPDLRKIIFGN